MGLKNAGDQLSALTIQILAWFTLYALFILDRILLIVQPPASEMWYYTLFGIGVFGKSVGKVVELFGALKTGGK